MSRTLRLLLGVVLLFALGGIAVEKRSRAIRLAFQLRREVDRNAALGNEIRYVEGRVLRLQDTGLLLESARRLGADPGERWGRVVRAPAASNDSGQ